MAVNLLTAAVLLAAAPLITAQDAATAGHDCSYMQAIPRPERPSDWPTFNFDGLNWATRPLLPAPERLDLCMDQYYPQSATSGVQLIFMDEDVDGDIPIAKLNYQGTAAPVMHFSSGRNAQLGAVIRQNDAGEWYIYVTQSQDFEEGHIYYLFEISVEGENLVASVSLTIVNIDNKPPRIEAFDACQVDELGEARLTECVYNVHDPDGQISTSVMAFEIVSDRGDEDIFHIQGHVDSSDWFTMTMTIGIKQPLDFEANALHIFSVKALDSVPNIGPASEASIMVQVQNVEHRPPRWVVVFAVQQFDEKTAQQFPVRAIDGDIAINKPIHYDIITEEGDDFFSITTLEGGRDGGVLHVAPIDRDALQREVFRLTLVAYKYDNRTFATEANVVIIVNDINDQFPEPLQEEYRLSIPEETPLTLNFGDQLFGFHDRDLGENAQYDVRLVSVRPENVAAAFYVAPEVGYQQQTFIMGTVNHAMLDYEVPEFQHIEIQVVATDRMNTSMQGIATVYIDLINWNDEEPIFEAEAHSVSFEETVGAGFHVATVRANDRDIGDRVEHSLMGNAAEFLRIDETTGDIVVSVDEAFDYHRQNEFFIQIRAVDTLGEGPYHTETNTLTINVLDINNTPPSLRLPRGSPQVEENVPEGYVITTSITATDPDTTAYLRFHIDWDTSYATKQGRETPAVEFHNCVEMITVHNEGNTGSANGHLLVKEIRDGVTIDFEEFEVLYLTVRVVDENTVIGDDSDEMTFTIIIIDMNDNWPIWSAGTLEQRFLVRENATSGVVVGSVLATDIDGPLYNQVRYFIQPIRDTPEDLMHIDFRTGQLTVGLNHAIDADIPPREHLYYTVTASDRCFEEDPADCPDDPTYWETPGEISIYITDTNNKEPRPDYTQFQVEVEIYEDAAEGSEVVQLVATDQDREAMYHTVRYQINYVIDPDLRRFFAVEQDTGRVYIDFTTDAVLDRDGEEPTHRIFINLIDNLYSEGEGASNTVAIEVLVILLDVNDNAPELPSPDLRSWPVSEGLTQGVRLSPDIHAHDRDQPFTDNSRVAYEVVGHRALDRDVSVPDLFTIVTVPNEELWEFRGELETAMDLRGYWGTYEIRIRAYDHGDPMLDSFEWYQVSIAPYNFHAPEFVFPLTGTTVRLSKERSANGPLVTVADAFLESLHATDEDGLHAGEVDFSVVGNADAIQYFEIDNLGDNRGELRLARTFDEDVREFQVTIRATDRGTEPGPRSTDTLLTVVFVPSLADPTFANDAFTVAFMEQQVNEAQQLPLAEDLKNYRCEVDACYSIYYRIVDGNSEGHFELEASTNALRVVRALDREVASSHQLVVAATNSPTATPTQGSLLTVTVLVRESNPRPTFVRSLYTAGISTLDTIGRELLTVQATHSENALLTYEIDSDSMQVDSSLETVRQHAFQLHPQTGVLTLQIQPTANMHGMFEFDVVAADPAGETDRAEVKVYLISSRNRVSFIFVNTVEEIEANRDFIAETFSTAFEMTCNIDQVTPNTDDSGVALADQTDVRAHLIRGDIPVPAEEIELIRADTQLLFTVQIALRTRQLQLLDFVTELSPDAGADASLLTIYVLAALSAVLGFLCLLLLITFIIRTRTLNRRLEALSMTKYGSVDSGLNRAGLAAPGTNKYATEGANPIWNETFKAPDFDAISDASGDSDLIGIEDLPQFRSDFLPPADASSQQGFSDPAGVHRDLPTHSNNFGFYSSPFSQDFAERQFRRN
ncbi:protocadherin Fat 1-like [Leguminivora glycinivorella]|uniref:protocadherin Fat 1-like n=1 Tax=Leguminivora glycinivorella TaxID=1035111 RepID=UPI00200E1176|nr:protocadherin Fat 1-like [Leguminivora glycinivorella]XP_047999388.1 protocadherin Fat 1-like [Leguminivora glycinivorella]